MLSLLIIETFRTFYSLGRHRIWSFLGISEGLAIVAERGDGQRTLPYPIPRLPRGPHAGGLRHAQHLLSHRWRPPGALDLHCSVHRPANLPELPRPGHRGQAGHGHLPTQPHALRGLLRHRLLPGTARALAGGSSGRHLGGELEPAVQHLLLEHQLLGQSCCLCTCCALSDSVYPPS